MGGHHVHFGNNVYANFNLTVLDTCPVNIGDSVFFGPNCTIATPVHPLRWQERNMKKKADGSLYDDEYGKPNLEEAEKYLVKASQAGNADAIYELACLCLKRKDLKGYLTHLSMAADMGCPESYAELCDAYQQGPDRGLELNFEQASKMRKLSRYAEADEWIPTLLSFGYKMDNYFK